MASKEERDLKEVLGNWGLAFELLKALIHAILKKGGTIEHLRRILKEPELALKMADMLVDKAVAAFSALVTYIQPSLAALKSAFDWVDDFYAKADFKPIDRCKDVNREQREVSFKYVHLNRDASTDEVLAETDRQNLRPALYEELLAFGAKYPDEQRQFPIVALGSVCRNSSDGLYVAYLNRCGSERGLYLHRIGRGWGWVCRFLVVRKQDPGC
ncbi:MAG: hypothetical protein HY982_01435 [Candidatus Magasanikbacteria bacterium]|nr:hypothetical protein [Candidatus Magasanikbacteria bacterium]